VLAQIDTNSTLFELAIIAEKRAAHCYSALASLFRLHPEIHAFWKEMQADEEIHARMLGDLRDALESAELEREAEPSLVWKARDILRAAHHERVGEVATLADAYQLAHDLEHCEVNAVLSFLLHSHVPRADKGRFLDAVLVEHQDKLGRFAERVGGTGRMRTIAAIRTD